MRARISAPSFCLFSIIVERADKQPVLQTLTTRRRATLRRHDRAALERRAAWNYGAVANDAVGERRGVMNGDIIPQRRPLDTRSCGDFCGWIDHAITFERRQLDRGPEKVGRRADVAKGRRRNE